MHAFPPLFRTRASVRRPRPGLWRLEPLEARQLLAVNVTTTDDSGAGSLREAIDKVNTDKVADTITFENLGAGTIKLVTALPALTNPAGTAFAFGGTTTSITLDGSAAPAGADGLTIGSGANSVSITGLSITIQNFDSGLVVEGSSTGSTIKGLTLTRNATGIELTGGNLSDSTIAGNTITLNAEYGILATGGVTGLTLGGSGAGNTLRYNDTGMFFQPGTYTGTVVQGNTVTASDNDGIRLGSAGGSLLGLTLGGAATGAGNTVTYNQDNGVEVVAGTFTDTAIQGNSIASNGGYGIQLSPSGQTIAGLVIGGGTTGEGNTIEANAADGIGVFGGTFTNTAIQGNTIRYNQNGVSLNLRAGGGAFAGLLVGGATTVAAPVANTIMQNSLDGVLVNAGAYSSTLICGNTITSNGRNGIGLLATLGGEITGLQVGGAVAGLGNTITGNGEAGVAATKGDYTGTTVLGNALSSNANGLALSDATNLTVGGTAASSGNTVSTNTYAGLFGTGILNGTGVLGNAFTGNPVGISLVSAQGVAIGGSAAGAGNAVSAGATGLRATGTLSGTTVSGNSFTGQTTGIQLINAMGAAAKTPFFVGGAATTPGKGAGNYVASTVHGLVAAGSLANTTVAGNIFSASAFGGNAMVLQNATGLTVGGATAGFGNTLTAAKGNGLWAAGLLTGTGFYKNNLTASQNGALLINARNFLFGVANNPALGNLVQYNQVGVRALGNCSGSGVCYTSWVNNVRKVLNSATGLVLFPKP